MQEQTSHSSFSCFPTLKQPWNDEIILKTDTSYEIDSWSKQKKNEKKDWTEVEAELKNTNDG